MSQRQLILLIALILAVSCGMLTVFRDRYPEIPMFSEILADPEAAAGLIRLNAPGEQVDDFMWREGYPHAFVVSHESNPINALRGNSDRHLRIYDTDLNVVNDIAFSERGMRAHIREDGQGNLYYGGTRFRVPDYQPEAWFCDGDGPDRPTSVPRVECEPPGAIARADGRIRPFQMSLQGRKSMESLLDDRTLTYMGYYQVETTNGPFRFKLLDDYAHPSVERYPVMRGRQVLLYRPGGSAGALFLMRAGVRERR
ncbi:MAG: hypothetical protein LBL59_02705 [Xanthomonadaceae bacterium]|jgi:hypothetical protein|nr:hypothetical protein [Xanthomonadaceae bacterium]